LARIIARWLWPRPGQHQQHRHPDLERHVLEDRPSRSDSERSKTVLKTGP